MKKNIRTIILAAVAALTIGSATMALAATACCGQNQPCCAAPASECCR